MFYTLIILKTDFSANTGTNPHSHREILLYSLIMYLYCILCMVNKSLFLFIAQLVCSLEDRYVVVNLGLLSLCDALSNPDDVAALLLLQFDVGVKHSKVELLQEGQCVHLHL